MRQQTFSASTLVFLGAAHLLSFTACGSTVVGGGGGAGGGSTTSTSSGVSMTASGGPASSSSGTAMTSSGNPTTSSGSMTSSGNPTTSSGSMTSSGNPTTSSSSSGSTCPGSAPLTGPCAPGASCNVGGSTCLAHVNQAASPTPGFRIAEIKFTKPAAFTTGIVSSIISNSATPNDAGCNLNGSATFSWLLRFDLAAGTLTTGGAKPSVNPAGPYTFVDENIQQLHVQPVTLTAPLSAGCGFSSSTGDMLLPMYLDNAATQALLLPLRALQFQNAAMSADHGCIGRYNAANLDPANSCLPESQNPAFTSGGAAAAHMLLEDTDATIIGSLNQSLCVLLSQDPATYGTKNAQNVTVCKRDASNKIVFKGDWCAATDSPASSGCSDAMQVALKFAAQAVKIQ